MLVCVNTQLLNHTACVEVHTIIACETLCLFAKHLQKIYTKDLRIQVNKHRYQICIVQRVHCVNIVILCF